MFPRWLTFIAFLASLSNLQGAAADALRVKPTCGVKGRPEQQLTLKCGDGTNTGEVRYWHTPFGELRSHSFPSKLDPVFARPDGSLVIPNSSAVHSGLYYCLLHHTGGVALWPYELHVGHHHQGQKLDDYQQSLSYISFSRDVGSEKQNDVFAGAVAASVLLTFVFGFSIGALSRTHILRFLGFVTKRLRSSRQQTDVVDFEFTVTSPPTTPHGFEMGNLQNDESNTDTSSPPIKPQRSFRHNKEEERKTEEEEAGKSAEGKKKQCEEEERQGGGNPNETEEKDGGQSQEEEDNKSNEDRGSEEEKKTEDDEETTKTAEDKDSQHQSTDSGDNESDGRSQDSDIREKSCPARSCRVIRLYQFDEDGQRYCHLPEPAPHDPVPRPRQRTHSLTRLSAIMAAATAGPLDRQEAGGEARTRFCMDI